LFEWKIERKEAARSIAILMATVRLT